ncbi:MAG: hypothetical protein LRZ84_00120 [Desertifilum sp.]|nr:hypothetical protein [Desertifilum sp.]
MTELCYPHLGLFLYTSTEHEEDKERLEFIPRGAKDSDPIDGLNYFCPLDDTEGLLALYSITDEPHHPPKQLSCLHKLKQKINSDRSVQTFQQISSSRKLGKTWILLGILPSFWDSFTTNLIAKEASQIFNFGQHPLPSSQKFMGATVYELWISPVRWQDLDQENNHIVIILYPDRKALDSFDQFKQDWMRLFYYRNKILWAYNNSQTPQIRAFLKEHLLPLDPTVPTQQLKLPQGDELEANLDKLRQLLQQNYLISKQYSQYLSFLEVQLQTLQTNFYNYQERRNSLIKKAKAIGTTDDDLLQSFIEIPAQRYQLQLEKDIAALSPGLRGRDAFINTIRGLVDIEQAKSDRNLNFIIAGASIGLATSGVTATILSTQVYQPENTQNNRMPFTRGFLWSLSPIFFFVFIGAVAWYRKR